MSSGVRILGDSVDLQSLKYFYLVYVASPLRYGIIFRSHSRMLIGFYFIKAYYKTHMRGVGARCLKRLSILPLVSITVYELLMLCKRNFVILLDTIECFINITSITLLLKKCSYPIIYC